MGKLIEFLRTAWALGPTLTDKWVIFWRQTKNLRVRLRVAAYHPQEIYTLNTRYGRLHFRDNFGDITNLGNLLYRETYQIKQVKHPGVILDIGANIGLAAVWFAYHNPDRPIFCFEPLLPNVAMVRRNCAQAFVMETAVGAARGEMTLDVDVDSVMASQNVTYNWQTQPATFPVLPLDEFLAEQNVDDIALIKMDAEGGELEIFAGGQAAFARAGQVAMETHGAERHRESLNQLAIAGLKIDAESFDGRTGMIFASRDL